MEAAESRSAATSVQKQLDVEPLRDLELERQRG
jgi:hypothetical protein